MVYFTDIQSIHLLLPIVGLAVGLFGTMLGGGGGFFFLPLLTLFYKVPTQDAVLTSLVATLPICIVGVARHKRHDHVDMNTGFRFVIFGTVGALLGTFSANLIDAHQLQVGFGVYSVVMAMLLSFRQFSRQKSRQFNDKKKQQILFHAFGYGMPAGIITGAFGTSGSAPIIAGLFVSGLQLKLVVGTSLLIVLVNSVIATAVHAVLGTIDLTIVIALTIGSSLGAFWGPSVMSKIDTKSIEGKSKYVYAIIIGLIGIMMILK